MADDDALQTLREVEAVRERTRLAVHWAWLPFLVFGLATLGSTPFTPIEDSYAVGIYWLIAGPLGIAVTVVGYRRMEIHRGVIERRESLYLLVIAAMFAASMAIGWFAADTIASEVGPMFPVGIGLLVLGVVDRHTLLLAAGGLIVGIGAALIVIAPETADAWAAASSGIVLIAAGLIERSEIP
jgi:hypothetical protein